MTELNTNPSEQGLSDSALACGVRRCFLSGFPFMAGSAKRNSCVYFKTAQEAEAWVVKYGHYFRQEVAS